MARNLDSGKEVIRTGPFEKNQEWFITVFTLALNVGFFQLIDTLKLVWVPLIANVAIFFRQLHRSLKTRPRGI